ncbi:energy transducer TonB [Vitiosangium sp. GDMCC 1.1324]|uniref:energy transducer TonB n=1 Tax=Vitiosangium sp. (strain GDMCC 1.1324) TaxID=2138576 RepID=UPI000D35BD14|nr:energy transducer TonB [Vitiosangium sp. GDMCC 1.1324]PTL84730.1 energy transducer TonB [Vitiosangium sp. GDMCC 1.1324]
MFETFDSATDVQSARRFALSTVASLGVCALLGLGVVVVGSQVREVIKEKRVDVVFRPPPPPVAEVKPPPPPPPPPPPKPKAKPPPPAPTVAAPAAMLAPKEIPVEKPPEADAEHAVAAAPIAVGGTGQLVAGAIVTGVDSPGVAGGMRRAAPINLPEAATPPRELESNVSPEFPSDMRAKGQEGMVILKVVVEVDGHVSNIKVMRGEEPFVSAALAAVKTWRYEPALVDGQPTAVFRIVKIPFRLK